MKLLTGDIITYNVDLSYLEPVTSTWTVSDFHSGKCWNVDVGNTYLARHDTVDKGHILAFGRNIQIDGEGSYNVLLIETADKQHPLLALKVSQEARIFKYTCIDSELNKFFETWLDHKVQHILHDVSVYLFIQLENPIPMDISDLTVGMVLEFGSGEEASWLIDGHPSQFDGEKFTDSQLRKVAGSSCAIQLVDTPTTIATQRSTADTFTSMYTRVSHARSSRLNTRAGSRRSASAPARPFVLF